MAASGQRTDSDEIDSDEIDSDEMESDLPTVLEVSARDPVFRAVPGAAALQTQRLDWDRGGPDPPAAGPRIDPGKSATRAEAGSPPPAPSPPRRGNGAGRVDLW